MSLLGIKLDPRISLGNILTATAFVVTAIYAAGQKDVSAKQLRNDVDGHGTRLEHVENRVSALEVSTGRSAEAFDWIKRNIQDLKEAMNAKR